MYKLLIGLGNPGKQYQNTRHNLGQVLVKKYARSLNIDLKTHQQFLALIGTHRVGESKIILATPTTYMNLSGQSVAKIVNFYKILSEDIYVVHDDLDLGVGESKIQFDRGPAGHNGIKSIIDHLGTQAFWRLRLGIGHPQDATPVENYVLLPPTSIEVSNINFAIDNLVSKIDKVLTVQPKSSCLSR